MLYSFAYVRDPPCFLEHLSILCEENYCSVSFVFLSFQKGREKDHAQSKFYSVLLKFLRNKRM